jgi:hypothetical protein
LASLTREEKSILKKIRNKKRRFFLSTLGGFLLLIPIGYFYSINRQGTRYGRFDDESLERMQRITPWFMLFVLILIIIYFIRYYFKLIHPVNKDLEEGMKEVLYYDPGKYQTPFFAEYFIITPIAKRSRIRISKEIFDKIRPDSFATISYSIYSHFIFSIEVDNNKILFNETNERIDE